MENQNNNYNTEKILKWKQFLESLKQKQKRRPRHNQSLHNTFKFHNKNNNNNEQ